MADTTRIDQFRKMASDDPDNPLGHFSLGREYLNAGLFAEAAASLERALQIDPNITKAYQLLGSALLKQGQRDRAVERLTEGARRADERGDLLPRNEMTRMLTELGAPVPELKAAPQAQQPVGEGEVRCARCNRVNRKLAKPPFRNPLGQEIYEKVCYDCWQEWIRMGTKVINEMRLDLSSDFGQAEYDRHLREFMGFEE